EPQRRVGISLLEAGGQGIHQLGPRREGRPASLHRFLSESEAIVKSRYKGFRSGNRSEWYGPPPEPYADCRPSRPCHPTRCLVERKRRKQWIHRSASRAVASEQRRCAVD